jgi:hypothetical protein
MPFTARPTRRELLSHGVIPPRAKDRETIARAIADIKGHRDKPAAAPEGARRRLAVHVRTIAAHRVAA